MMIGCSMFPASVGYILSVYLSCRVELRKNYIRISHEYHLEVKSQSTKPHIKNRTVDDAVRYLSFLFAASNAVDKATLLAKTVCANEWVQTRCHNKLKANLQAWLGL